MFDLLITYINFIILSIKFIVSFLAFRPPNPKGVRIIDKKDEKNENNDINSNIEILFSVPIKKENENKNKENNNPNNNENNNINNKENKENKSAENNINNNNNNNNINNNANNNINNNANNNLNNNANNNNNPNNNKKNIKTKMEYKPATNKYSDFELLFSENSDTKIKIPAFIFKPKDFYQFNCIIIYCHGNSGDIRTSFMKCQI